MTLVCAAQNPGIALAATYGGLTMTTVITNQQSSFYVGMFYLNYPPPGAQTVTVQLTAAPGTTNVECSATTWTGTTGIDTSIASTSQEFGSNQFSVSIAPKMTVPSNEVFFSAIHLYQWGTTTGLYVQGTGAAAHIVDSD